MSSTNLPEVKVVVCPKCGSETVTTPETPFHGLAAIDVKEAADQQPAKHITVFLPVKVYECVNCHYIELYGAARTSK